jgi:hypothetical protein
VCQLVNTLASIDYTLMPIQNSNKSAIAAFLFDSDGTLQPPAQITQPTSNVTGPIASRQSDSHAHHVILDPSRRFFLVPDLGADLIRVFKYHTHNFAPLAELEPLRTEAGAGPRHGVFWRAPGRGGDEGLYLIFNGELSQKVYSYRITYTSSGLKWEKVFETYALGRLGETLLPNTAPTSEIVVSVSLSAFIFALSHLQSRLTMLAGPALPPCKQSPAFLRVLSTASQRRQ